MRSPMRSWTTGARRGGKVELIEGRCVYKQIGIDFREARGEGKRVAHFHLPSHWGKGKPDIPSKVAKKIGVEI